MPISVNKGIHRITPPPSIVVPGFTSFPGGPESTITFKVASNVQRYNPAPLVLSINNYWIILPGHTPNVHLIPSSNSNDQSKYIHNLPLFAIQFASKSVHPLLCSHSPSKFPRIPYLGRSIPLQAFLTLEYTKSRHIPTSKPSY